MNFIIWNFIRVVSGWGRLREDGEMPKNLINAKITIYNDSMCRNVSTNLIKNWLSQICAGDYNGTKDTCQGFININKF